MKKAIYRIWQFTWGLPQSLIGLVLYIKYRKSPHHEFRCSMVTNWPVSGGISLGMFTFVENKKDAKNTFKIMNSAILYSH